jgi:hypothetical protein
MELELLQLVEIRYKKLLLAVNKEDAAKKAVDEIFNCPIKPYIYSDNMNDPIYIMYGEYCLLFGIGIYKKI